MNWDFWALVAFVVAVVLFGILLQVVPVVP